MITEILENELKNAVEVKDEKSLHRYVAYLSNQILGRQEHVEQNETEHASFREAVLKMDAKTDAILIEMREGFRRVDERFSAVDKRFTSLQWFLGIGFIVLSVLITLMQYLN